MMTLLFQKQPALSAARSLKSRDPRPWGTLSVEEREQLSNQTLILTYGRRIDIERDDVIQILDLFTFLVGEIYPLEARAFRVGVVSYKNHTQVGPRFGVLEELLSVGSQKRRDIVAILHFNRNQSMKWPFGA